MRINCEISELQAFIAVAEKSSFKAAAEGLFVSQPALSRRIDKLETTLAVRLIERTTRRVALTEAGRQFLPHAREALESLERAVTALSDRAMQRAALVTVACIPSVAYRLLPAVLKHFSLSFPATRVKILDESAPAVLQAVVQGVADFGLNFIGAQEPEVEFRAVCREKYLLAMRREHRLARRDSVSWEDIAGEKFISVSASSGNRMLIDNALARAEKRPVIQFEANHIAGALAMVEAGLGVAAVPQLSLSGQSSRSVVGVPLVKPSVSRTLGIICRKGSVLPPPADALRNMMAKAVRSARSGALA